MCCAPAQKKVDYINNPPPPKYFSPTLLSNTAPTHIIIFLGLAAVHVPYCTSASRSTGKYDVWSGSPQAAWNDDYGSKNYEFFDVWAPEMVRCALVHRCALLYLQPSVVLPRFVFYTSTSECEK